MQFQSLIAKIPWRRKWQPTPVFLPEKTHGQRNLAGRKELDMTEQLTPAYKTAIKTQRDGMGREAGGEIGMGSTYKSMADSCQCMAKTTTIL